MLLIIIQFVCIFSTQTHAKKVSWGSISVYEYEEE